MILVVGVDGLIGGGLYRALTESGVPVVGTSRRSGGGAIHLDLSDPDSFVVPDGIKAAVICAGVSALKQCAEDPVGTSRINVDGTMKIAHKISANGGAVIFLSTNLVSHGSKPFAPADAPLAPCCEYGRQKACLEEKLQGPQFACVRLTKVVETLGPRFKAWKETLSAGEEVRASTQLRFSPVALNETCAALVELAWNFQPGTFHISGDRDFSYYEAATGLASAAGAAESLVKADDAGGADLFDPLPRFGTLGPAAPSGCSRWRFSPASDTLARFLRAL